MSMSGLLGNFFNNPSSSDSNDPIGLLALKLMSNGGGQINPLMAMALLNANNSSKPQNAAPASNNAQTSPPGQNFGLLNTPTQTGVNYPTQPPSYTSLPTDKQALLSQLKQSAVAAYPDNPVMQQVALTQAIQESGLMGSPSQLASKYNNYFGIKAPGTAGSVDMPTTEYSNGQRQHVNANFGSNNSPTDSFMQYQHLLGRPRYQNVVNSGTPRQAFSALQQAGYATDPNYSNNLNNVYRKYVQPLYESS